MKKTRFLSLLLTAALLCSMLSGLTLSAGAAETSGKCGDNASWSFSNGTLTISGSGSVQTLDLMMGKLWAPYVPQIRSVVVQSGITEIGSLAFSSASQLTRVSLPNTLKSLGDMAFAYCASLQSITLPDSITNMGGGVFLECPSLTSLKFPAGLKTIWSQILKGCVSLRSVTLPSGAETIMTEAFSGCTALSEVTIPESVSSIDTFAFDKCGKLTLTILNPNCKIADNSELGCTLGRKESTVIRCYENSTAFVYAKENGYEYELLKKTPFADVAPDAYYAEAVSWALESGVTTGTGPSTFSPNSTCTRAQVVTFLWRVRGQHEPKNSVSPFTDVPKDAYYYKAVLWAKENGITAGTSDDKFSPDKPCTRAQVVTFLWRAKGAPFIEQASNPFKDVPRSAYYAPSVLWAVNDGITKGTGADTFSPDAVCTRGQIVTFLYRSYTAK